MVSHLLALRARYLAAHGIPRGRWLPLRFLRDFLRAAPALMLCALMRDPARRLQARHRVKTHLGLVPFSGAAVLPPLAWRDGPDPGGYQGPVAIVLPVHDALALLRETLDRIDRNTCLPWHLYIVDDCSADPAVRPFLREWCAARRSCTTLIELPRNRGFPDAANRGFSAALAQGRGPIVLLNSDAFLPSGWAPRLLAPLSRPRIASVTPMSNFAEIASAPVICGQVDLLPGQAAAMDQVAARLAMAPVDAPCGVGFCMAISRRWLERVPRFDPVFSPGYGEEVDWCHRIRALGGRHLIHPGVFVEHRGGGSFGTRKAALVTRHNALIARRHPDHDQQVQDFIARDPLLAARLALGITWAGAIGALPVHLAHSMGGGAETALGQRLAKDTEDHGAALVLRVGGVRRWRLELHAVGVVVTGETDDTAMVQTLCALPSRRHISYSCGVGDPDPITLPGFLCGLKGPEDRLELCFHDYFPLSPSYTLLGRNDAFRGLPEEGDPAHALRRPDGGLVTLRHWQSEWRNLAEASDKMTVFSAASADLVADQWPRLADRIHIRPHRLPHVPAAIRAPVSGSALCLGVLGHANPAKGARVLASLSPHLHALGGDLVIMGNLDPTCPIPDAMIHGGYVPRQISGLARRYGVTHWLIASVWPETFSFTTWEALATGLPVLGFDLGAQGEALAKAPNGHLLPYHPDPSVAAGRVWQALAMDARARGPGAGPRRTIAA
ncbi:glycosyltransferase [Pseudooceanicola aestuarii]|uniref:glycosyltransferase n=1 Tax=Pseudooceanicola aestuarii TaxID=2697319 RepID=UPI0013D0997F|nr:glycosyltransferase [Pseudooceanicola aestuarii]